MGRVQVSLQPWPTAREMITMEKMAEIKRRGSADRHALRQGFWRGWVLAFGLAWACLAAALAPLASAQGTVDPRLGSLNLTATDLVVPAGPVHLEVRRWLYTGGGETGLLGTRWRLNWDIRLIKHGDAVLIQEEPGEVAFAPTGTKGEYRGPMGERLVYGADGRAVRSKGDTPGRSSTRTDGSSSATSGMGIKSCCATARPVSLRPSKALIAPCSASFPTATAG